MTVALDHPLPARVPSAPATIRIGLLGLGNVGSAVARLAQEAAEPLRMHGVQPLLGTALVRSATRERPAGSLVSHVTEDPDRFFADEPDVVVEALGGVTAAHALVTRALALGIPVVTANKSLIAAHGDELLALADRHHATLRYEASCIAGVPFLGTYERRPLATRVHRITAVLNGTSNAILSAIDNGSTYAEALEDAQRRGLAEPDPSSDVTGADAAQKLTILLRLFGQVRIDPATIPSTPLDVLYPSDLEASADWKARIKPIAQASWRHGAVHAFVAPAFLAADHPLANLPDVTNGIILDGIDGAHCFTGPGAGPAVTAATLLDDVVEVATERTVRHRAREAAPCATVVDHPLTGWFVRVEALTTSELADMLMSAGIWCDRLASHGNCTYALTLPATLEGLRSAAGALRAAGGRAVLAIPALDAAEAAC
jgi:homoserine dehydrogenase